MAGGTGIRAGRCPCRASAAEALLRRLIGAAPGLLLKLFNPLGGFSLGEIILDLLTGLAGKRLEISSLGGGHRLIAGLPFLRMLEGAGSPVLWILVLLRHGKYL